jgi:hypothetical protein
VREINLLLPTEKLHPFDEGITDSHGKQIVESEPTRREGDEAGRLLHPTFGHRKGVEALHSAFQGQNGSLQLRRSACEQFFSLLLVQL